MKEKKRRIYLGIALAIFSFLCVIPMQAHAKETVRISKTTATFYVGRTGSLKVKGTSRKVKWTSSNKKVATVNRKGKVTAKKAGTVTITAKIGKKSYRCWAKVRNPHLNTGKSPLLISKGKTYTLKMIGATARRFASNNSKVATVSSKGKIQAKGVGTATISCKASNKKTYRCSVQVTNNVSYKKCSHTWKAATCTKAKTCTKCGQEEGFPLGHVIKNATCTTPETCTRCGKTTGPVKEHQWEDANCHHPKRCLNCGKEEGSCTEHKWVEATCVMWGYCSICGEKSGDALGHNDVYEVIQQPTKTETGIQRCKCTRCGLYHDETIPELGEETPWVYNEDRSHREKTMYDGSIIRQDWIVIREADSEGEGEIARWGWIDDEASEAMSNAICDLLAAKEGCVPFDIEKEPYYEFAQYQAMLLDYKINHNMAPCDSIYQALCQGLPDVETQKTKISLSNYQGEEKNYIACFVHGGYEDAKYDDYVYGENWRLYFATTYASAH